MIKFVQSSDKSVPLPSSTEPIVSSELRVHRPGRVVGIPRGPDQVAGGGGVVRRRCVCRSSRSFASHSQLLTWSVWFPFAALIARCSSCCGFGVGFLRRPPRADGQVTQLRTCARAFKSGGGAAAGFGGFESRGGGGAAEGARRQQLAAAREACEAFCAPDKKERWSRAAPCSNVSCPNLHRFTTRRKRPRGGTFATVASCAVVTMSHRRHPHRHPKCGSRRCTISI